MYTDEQYVEAVHSGDSEIFDSLVRKYFDSMVRFALGITGSNDVAHDVAQDVLVSIWLKGKEWHPRSTLAAYIFSAVRNRSLDIIKSDKNRQLLDARLSLEYQTQGYKINGQLDEVVISDSIEKGMESLTLRQKEAIHLRYFEGLTLQEVAHVLNIDLRSTTRLISRSLAVLSSQLDDLRK